MCSYLRFVYSCGTVRYSFLVGGSRSSPARPISIPRLELQAAILSVYRVLLDEPTYKISKAVHFSKLKINNIDCWVKLNEQK